MNKLIEFSDYSVGTVITVPIRNILYLKETLVSLRWQYYVFLVSNTSITVSEETFKRLKGELNTYE